MSRLLRPRLRLRSLVLLALSSLGATLVLSTLATLSACAGDEAAEVATVSEGGSDAPLLGDTLAHDADAELPLGDTCGDSQGLEEGAPWPMRGGCPKRAGVATSAGPRGATVKWSVALPAGDSSPAIDADRLIWVGTTDAAGGGGDVLVLSSSGIVQAALRTGGPVRSSPVRSATGLAIVGSSDGALYGVDRFGDSSDAGAALDAGIDAASPFRPARAVFRLPLAPIVSSPAVGGDGTIFVGTTAGKLVAVAADGSSVKWEADTGDTLGSSPAIALDGTVYVGSSDGKLYAFTRQGAPRWSFATGGAITGSPAIGGDDTIYVGSSDGKLYAITPEGELRWAYATGGPTTGAPAVRGGVVYVGSEDNKLHAIATPSGERRWSYETLGAVATPVVDVEGTVFVGSADGKLYAIAKSGLLAFAVNARGRIRSAPALGDDGMLYVTTDTSIVAIGP